MILVALLLALALAGSRYEFQVTARADHRDDSVLGGLRVALADSGAGRAAWIRIPALGNWVADQ
jgi:hypothetical protein